MSHPSSSKMFAEEEPVQTIQFELSPLDLEDGQLFFNLKSPQLRTERKRSILTTPLFVAFFLFILSDDENLLDRFMVPGGIALLMYCFLFYEYRKENIRKKISKNFAKLYPGGIGTEGLVGPREFTIFPSGLRIVTNACFSESTWGSFSRIVFHEDYILIFPSPETCHHLPRHLIGEELFPQFGENLKKNAGSNVPIEYW